ncbi:MAG: prepilin-type N-terminal cleavage/methylation domain-containing protein [Rhodocyclaceae bacterium]|nr:prepilin-type N-terminal cleavage/methylation domain-containing protein [Rhodocyclaceae bacterium]
MSDAVPPAPTFARGFSLVEMAVVLVIVALLIGGMLLPMTAQDDMRRTAETRATLTNVQEALLGFAVVNGRLPCPASPGATGAENPAGGGNCVNFFNGFVPGITLGLQPVDTQGFIIDAWGRRIRYAVTNVSIGATTFTFTTGGAMNSAGLVTLAPDLRVCSTASGAVDPGTATADCAAGDVLSSSAVAVLLSTGKNGAGAAADEQANSAVHDRVFVSHEPTSGANEFDDIVLWLSTNSLINRMIAAGRLP